MWTKKTLCYIKLEDFIYRMGLRKEFINKSGILSENGRVKANKEDEVQIADPFREADRSTSFHVYSEE